MAEVEMLNLIDECIAHRFVDFNQLNDLSRLSLTFNDTSQRILALLNREINLEWLTRTYPKLGLCLSILRAHPVVISDERLFTIVMKCILRFSKIDGCNNNQLRANRWIRQQIRQVVDGPKNKMKNEQLLIEKVEKSSNNESTRLFWLKNYNLINLIGNEETKRKINENLLLRFSTDDDELTKKIAENIWENTRKNFQILNEETKQKLWLIHLNGLESDVICLLDNQNDQYNLFKSCTLNPDLYNKVVSILFSIFKATNYHFKPVKLASRLVQSICQKSNDPTFCSRLHPLWWLLLTKPKDFVDRSLIWETMDRLLTSKEVTKDEISFVLSINDDWLRCLINEKNSFYLQLVHSDICRQRFLTNNENNVVFECRKCLNI